MVVVSRGKYAENVAIKDKHVGLVAAGGDEGGVLVSGAPSAQEKGATIASIGPGQQGWRPGA